MKKKAFLAVLAVCVALTAGACGSGNQEKTDTAADSGTNIQEEPEADGEKSDEEESEKVEEKTTEGSTRLVSVKDIDKYVTIGEYKGLALDNTVEAITDDVLEAQIEAELDSHKEEVTASGEAVQEGDLVTIDFVGMKDGTAFDGGTANNYDLTVGQGGMIPGFEDGIIGMKKGETKEVPLTFPEEYGVEELNGQDVIFKITLQNFRRAPELTEEWVKENTDYTSVEEYKESIRSELEENAKENAKYQMYSTAWSMVLQASEIIEFPEEEIENCIAEFKKQIEVYAKQVNMELMDFVESQGYTEESFEDECRQYAEYKVKQNLIVQGIMDAEGISLDDKECLEIQDELIELYGAKDLADLIDQYGQVSVDESIGLLRVERLMVEYGEITDKISEGEQVGVDGNAGDSSAEEDTSEEETPEEASQDSAAEETDTEEE